MAFASHRHSIRWLPEDASEPTSTLVLTSKSGWYIDVRILLGLPRSLPSLSMRDDKLINIGERYDELSSDRLDWAFSGQGTSEPATDTTPARSSWNHWVDSKTKLHEPPIVDSGYMFPQDNGLTLEKGSMPNPATGLETEYEEIWEDSHEKESSSNLEGLKKYCVIFTNDQPEKFTRGCVMQLGEYCQGVLRIGDEIIVQRWKHAEEAWHLLVTVNGEADSEGWLHCRSLMEAVHGLNKDLDHTDVIIGSIKTTGPSGDHLEWVCKEIY